MYPGPVSWTHEGYGIGSNRKNSPNTKILVGRKKEGESLSITRDRQPRLWSTIGQLLILVVKRKPIPNSLCLQLGTVPCYAIWSRFEIPFLAATFLLSQPDWNLVHFRYLSFIDPAYTYFLLLRAAGPVPHRTEILFRKLAPSICQQKPPFFYYIKPVGRYWYADTNPMTFIQSFHSYFGKVARLVLLKASRLSLSTGIITPPSTNSIAAPSPIPRPEPGLKVQTALIHYRKVPVFHSDKDFARKHWLEVSWWQRKRKRKRFCCANPTIKKDGTQEAQ